jgi:2-succinyl-5-enolpyruvyl-6-hydroxy-3-cyclohexene-1-carboxylate synthase
MGWAGHHAPPAAGCNARANAEAALRLLGSLISLGLGHLVLCPGSRSAPLAVAAALLEPRGLVLHTAIDERSAAFFALGLGRASGTAAAVATTSGTAVAQLLAACVEADLGTIPLLLLSADRPARLKNCGANQAVPQERFLAASCRLLLQGPPNGMAGCSGAELAELAAAAMAAAHGDGRSRPAGPVHLNLAFEEPIHATSAELEVLQQLAATLPLPPQRASGSAPATRVDPACAAPRLDPDRPGVVIAGPWRGSAQQWPEFCRALRRWQARSGWPLLADPLSGLRGVPGLSLISAYDLLLEQPVAALAPQQLLRLGSLPASRRLERWLQACAGDQVLVSQGDPRRLDPLGTVPSQRQWSGGLAAWLAAQELGPGTAPLPAPSPAALALAECWRQAETRAQCCLDRNLARPLPARGATAPPAAGPGTAAAPAPQAPPSAAAAHDSEGISEPWLARALSRLLPAELPLMLASSSPVRDWESFADPRGPWRPIHGFRGASGIDGTLSIACGLAEALGQLVLVSGDLALLHDANGWLWSHRLRGRLTVVLIENGGGGIFENLPIRPDRPGLLDFDRLFAMPQPLDQLALAALHGVPGRRLHGRSELANALAWALEQPIALLEVRSQRRADAALRRQLRLAVSRENGALDPHCP